MDNSPTALFENYDEDFKQLLTSLKGKLEGDIKALKGEQRKAALKKVGEELEEAEEIIAQMDVELPSMPASIRQNYQGRLAASKAGVEKVKKTLKDIRSDSQRSDLLSGPGFPDGDDPYSDEPSGFNARTRLLQGTETLEDGSRRLDNARRIALETEDVGAGILRNLRGQREQIEHTRDTLVQADLSIDRAAGTLKKMIFKMFQQKFLSAGIIAVLIVLIDMLSSYRKLSRTYLQETIPGKIKHLRELIATESDPSSVLWPGHATSDSFAKPVLRQPTESELKKLAGEMEKCGFKALSPDEVVRGKEDVGDLDADDDDDDDDERVSTTATEGTGKVVGKKVVGRGARIGPHWFEVLPLNEVQQRFVHLSVQEHEDLNMLVQDLKIWLELEIPVIEDGNSFGADVQAHLNKELDEYIRRSNAFHNSARVHSLDRVKLAADWVKCPNLMDYQTAIGSADRFDHFLLRSYIRSLLRMYGGILTRFERNWDKVINPKGSGGSVGGMY
ncbi:MAG: hypothetical protein TREMPRED_001166 [Tremellales sp. Tagirdzhanova-0007]|nr:MAG: hypothetical protein TREMPRED_001166 [Tremellales sp. Tagirdzhanova-0007]